MHYGILLGTPSPFPLAAARETGSKIRPTTIPQCNLTHNHNYNKIAKSDWLPTVLISALIGQFDRTVRVMPK